MVLDPNDLAAKGATLLHHLAVWMLEEKRMTEKEGEEQPVSLDLKDPSGQPPAEQRTPATLPTSPVTNPEQSEQPVSFSTPRANPVSVTTSQNQQQQQQRQRPVSGRSMGAGSDQTSDRPDSGFDSNKDDSDEALKSAGTDRPLASHIRQASLRAVISEEDQHIQVLISKLYRTAQT